MSSKLPLDREKTACQRGLRRALLFDAGEIRMAVSSDVFCVRWRAVRGDRPHLCDLAGGRKYGGTA